MYMEILRRIDGIGIFPLVSLLLFVAVFAAVMVHVARADRAELARRAALPLDPSRNLPLGHGLDAGSTGSADRRTR